MDITVLVFVVHRVRCQRLTLSDFAREGGYFQTQRTRQLGFVISGFRRIVVILYVGLSRRIVLPYHGVAFRCLQGGLRDFHCDIGLFQVLRVRASMDANFVACLFQVGSGF